MSSISYNLKYAVAPAAPVDKTQPVAVDTEHGIAVNLKYLALGCIAGLLTPASTEVAPGYEQLYLQQFRLVGAQSPGEALDVYLAHPRAEDSYLLDLADNLGFSRIELLTIALALAVEEDAMAGRAIAHMQAPVGTSRPNLGLLQAALAPVADASQRQWIAGSIISGMAVRCGVLNIINTDAPLPEQSVRVPAALALALGNRDYLWPGSTTLPDEMLVRLPPSIRQQAEKQAKSLINQSDSVLVIRSASQREARSVASEVCKHLHQAPIFSDAAADHMGGLGALCLIKNLLPVFAFSAAPGESVKLPDLPGYHGARIVIMGPDGNVDSNSGSILQWTVAAPNQDERLDLWLAYLGDADLAARLARDHVHSSGRIMQLAQLSLREARLRQRDVPTNDDVMQASWTAEEGNLGSLVQPIKSRIPDEALVLPDTTRQELKHLLQRCKCRESLDDELGITVKARYQMGVRALFVGPSGTGKTLVASWIATNLGLPLYRVDIASVVSKYIGETEKNLSTLLAKAEQTEIVLLFDEADSLFGKRTEIKDSNDRHANSQTNYLLQRIEMYKGIVLLTSNSRGRFDSAFTRRLDKVIEFALPAPEERRALWSTHLGEHHDLSTRQLNQLAMGSELAGGHIRNAVLAAAVNARAHQRPICFDDIVVGLESEYRKLGRQIPSEIKRCQRLDAKTG